MAANKERGKKRGFKDIEGEKWSHLSLDHMNTVEHVQMTSALVLQKQSAKGRFSGGLLCMNVQCIVVLFQPLIGLWLIRQVRTELFIIPRGNPDCLCFGANNSHQVSSVHCVQMLLINTGLFSFCLLFISSNYHSKGGVFLARHCGKRRLKGNEETSVSLFCHKSASHSYHWHPSRQRLQCREKSKTPRHIGLANRGKGYHRNT